jgi:hypothetical protein
MLGSFPTHNPTHCHGRGRGFESRRPRHSFIPKGRHRSACSREEGSHYWCRDCYTQRVDSYFGDIALYQSLPVTSVQQLIESGFMIIPGPVLSPRLPELSSAYDEVMNSGASPDFKVGSTTTRMYDLVDRGRVFDDLYTYPPLLEACRHVIRGVLSARLREFCLTRSDFCAAAPFISRMVKILVVPAALRMNLTSSVGS